jgi:phosphoglycolate phosphatase-like HAD superfamily hydrolase
LPLLDFVADVPSATHRLLGSGHSGTLIERCNFFWIKMISNKAALITDIDNTIFDWFGMWHSSFTAMIAATSQISGVSENQLLSEAQPIHKRYGTSEYAFLLEELPVLQSLYGDRESIRSALASAIHDYREARAQWLVLYDTVLDTFNQLKDKGVVIIGFSESKIYYSSSRILALGLDGIIDYLYCPQDHPVPEGREPTLEILKKTKVAELKGNFKKPDPHILSDIMTERNFASGECLYVGDSLTKDIGMAISAGVDAVWLSSGASHITNADGAYDLLRKVTHWSDEDVKREAEISRNPSVIDESKYTVVTQYSEILPFFGIA